jgi:lysozyme
MQKRRLSQKGAELIGGFEGFRGRLYDDPVGLATIGYGHLVAHKRVAQLTSAERKPWAKGLTRKQGLALLRKDAKRFEDAVNRAVLVNLSQPQFDALVSFAFNIGTDAFRKSTLVKLLNAGHRTKAADQLLRWNRAGGRELAGLTARRRRERKLFLTGMYTDAPQKQKRMIVAGPSKSFSWTEVTRGRTGITPAVRARAILHARRLEVLKAALNARRKKRGFKPTGLNVISWWRPRWYNTKIGGAKDSRHIYGDAVDIAVQEVDRIFPWKGGRAEFDAVANRVFARGGFGQYPAGNRHVDSRGWKSRWTWWSR